MWLASVTDTHRFAHQVAKSLRSTHASVRPDSRSTLSAGCRSSNLPSWRSSWASRTPPSTIMVLVNSRASDAATLPQSSAERPAGSGRGSPVGALTPSPEPFGRIHDRLIVTHHVGLHHFRKYNNRNTISTINPTQSRSEIARWTPFTSPVFPLIQLRISPRLYSAMYSDSPYGPPRAKTAPERL